MATSNNRVKFIYVGAGSALPQSPDPDAIYFLQDDQKIYVGSNLIAGYQQLAKTAPGSAPAGTIKPGSVLTSLNSTSVSGMDITDISKQWTFALGTVSDADDSFVTGGDVYSAIQSAISGISGAMHLLGFTSTEVTDGGSEDPTINGTVIPHADLNAGDVVIYQRDVSDPGVEFVWSADSNGHWVKLGDDTSFVLRSTQVVAGSGLSGGGPLSSNVTISHGQPGTSSAVSPTTTAATDVTAVVGVEADGFGHVTGIIASDLSTKVADIASEVVDEEISGLVLAETTGDYIVRVSQTDGQLGAVSATFGSVSPSETHAVSGAAVYSAVQDASAKWTVI